MTTQRNADFNWLPIILASAFVLRFVGIWYGLPAQYNSDEPANLVSALSYGAKKSLQPSYFVYPSLYSYFLFFIYGLYFVAGKIAGVWQNTVDFGATYFLNPTGLYWVGRFASVALGTAAVWWVFKIGARFFSRTTGLLAAALLALSFTHTDLSHWILLEPLAALLCAAALFFILRFNENPTPRLNGVAGLLAGLALSTKYNAALVLLPLLVSIFLKYKSEPKRLFIHSGISAAAFGLGFLIGAPYFAPLFSKFWETFRYTLGHVRTGMSGHVSAAPVVWPLWELIFRDWSVGLVLVAGVIYDLFQSERKSWLLLAFALPTLLVVGAWNRTGVHYLAPIFPALAILAAIFLNDIFAIIKSRTLRAALLVIVLFPAAVKIIYQDIRLTQKDSRTLAQEWIETNLPIGCVIAYENYVYGPNLFDPARFLKNTAESALLPMALRERLLHERQLRPYFNLLNLRKDFSAKRIGIRRELNANLIQNSGQNPYLRQLWETRLPKLEKVKTAGAEYILISSDNYDRYFSGTKPQENTPLWFSYLNGRRFYESVFHSPDLILLNEFRPNFWSLGPVIRIYQFKN
jgi:hypothetical protein